MQSMTAPRRLPQQVFISRRSFWQEIRAKGVNIAHVTLHVGLGTFRPVKVEDVTQHHMHSEFYRGGGGSGRKSHQ